MLEIYLARVFIHFELYSSEQRDSDETVQTHIAVSSECRTQRGCSICTYECINCCNDRTKYVRLGDILGPVNICIRSTSYETQPTFMCLNFIWPQSSSISNFIVASSETLTRLGKCTRSPEASLITSVRRTNSAWYQVIWGFAQVDFMLSQSCVQGENSNIAVPSVTHAARVFPMKL